MAYDVPGAAGSGGGFPIVLIALTLNPSAALGPTLSVAAAPCHTGGGGLAAHQQRNPRRPAPPRCDWRRPCSPRKATYASSEGPFLASLVISGRRRALLVGLCASSSSPVDNGVLQLQYDQAIYMQARRSSFPRKISSCILMAISMHDSKYDTNVAVGVHPSITA
ncbi:uncharacterized protein LOC110432799 [Sorghum bicolor]|uniref:uncharacterized protein LOC110432799 n=1 Tax=Sorghum bicolor TaxID=4558 RepID=UPI000B425450|nr:uncharacterized protein LOC110432799 [Sorghum bicolor]|eukprot:XP_021309308.1 uncharacterized protein LOC110432799 [Sorghum bicolor]